MQRIRRGRDQERKDLHKSIRCCDSAEDQHNFPDGPFRPLPEILQTLNYGGTWCGCHGVSLTQNRFKFLTLLLNLRAPPVQRSRKIVLASCNFARETSVCDWMDFACCCRSAISFCFCWTASLISLTCAIFASTSVRETSSVCLLKVFAEVFRTFNKASKPFKIASFVKPPCDCAVARAALYLNALSLMTEESGAAKASILASSGTAEKSVCLASRA